MESMFILSKSEMCLVLLKAHRRKHAEKFKDFFCKTYIIFAIFRSGECVKIQSQNIFAKKMHHNNWLSSCMNTRCEQHLQDYGYKSWWTLATADCLMFHVRECR